MKRVFISQPMQGKSITEILKVRESAISEVKQKLGEEISILNNFFREPGLTPFRSLVRSLGFLSNSDVACFVKGWEDAMGCSIEHTCAEKYGIPIIELEGGVED